MAHDTRSAGARGQPRHIVIANPESRRWQFYHRDLQAYWANRGVVPSIAVVPWERVVSQDGQLDGLSAFDRPGVVRLESPGRNTRVARLLLAVGARARGEPPEPWLNLPDRKGWLAAPALLHEGFCRVLHGLQASFAARPWLRLEAEPRDLMGMFDKVETCRQFAAAGLPTPRLLTSAVPSTPTRLLDELYADARGQGTYYVKFRHGSSASGIAMVHAGGGPGTYQATTSVLARGGEFFNTRRLRHVRGEELHAVLGFVLNQGACVQEGIRMAQIDGQNFDVRVVTLNTRPAGTIFRLSSNPMTNLHLGGRRGDTDRCRSEIPRRLWLDALDACTEAAALYQTTMVGFDLLFERGYHRFFLLEANAFGDFVPGWVTPEGHSLHHLEIAATAERFSL